ncbi:unnamed protein product [Closterium sp. Naga37s-1]|nr:unnamed protein product [Closterium sp. Naga37s-1]
MQVWSLCVLARLPLSFPTLLPLPPPSAPAASWAPSLWDKAMQVWAGRMCARSSFETSQKAKQVWAGRICPRLSPTRSLPTFLAHTTLPPFPPSPHPPPPSPISSAHHPPPPSFPNQHLPHPHPYLLTIRSEYNVISTKLSKARGRLRTVKEKLEKDLAKLLGGLRTVKEKLEKDLGPDGEFLSFADHCISFNPNMYEYEVCPYRQVKQKEKHHSDTTCLCKKAKQKEKHHPDTTVGRWSGFEDNYRTMMFKNGDKYEAVLVTTAVCNAELAQELERQLKEMEDDLAGHDEL